MARAGVSPGVATVVSDRAGELFRPRGPQLPAEESVIMTLFAPPAALFCPAETLAMLCSNDFRSSSR